MENLDQAIEKKRAEIEHLEKYVEQLKAAQRELTTLMEAREILTKGSPTQETLKVKTKHTIVGDLLEIVSSNGNEKSLSEIMEMLTKTRKGITHNSVTSILTRLVRENRIKRLGVGRYQAVGSK